MLESLKRFLSFTPASKKSKMLSLISLITLTATIPFSLYLLQQQQDIRSRAQEVSSENRRNTEEPKYQGYVVELKKEPVVAFREKKKKEGESISALESETRDHKRALQEEHEQAKADILQRLGVEPEISARGIQDGGQVILREYDTVFNGIALDISDEQKEKIKESPFVKNISPNYQVKAFLNDSVPLVNANQVWSLGSISGPVTGKDVNVAIIDTGVDYTHPDLGETRITERVFDQITPNPITPFTNSQYTLDQVISLNNNRVAYLSGNKIYIYYFSTQNTAEVSLFAENLTPQRLVLRDNILVYVGVDENAGGALYLANLTTGEERKIVDADEMSLVSIIDGKVVYGRNDGDDPSVNVYIYDITSGRETVVTNQRGYIYFPKASGNKVVWPVSGKRCYDKAVVYDINTGQSQDIFPPDIGPILDFKDNRILYVACSKERFDRGWKTFYLYDIETRVRTRLFYDLPQEVGVGNVMSQEHGGFGMWSWISKGGIGEGVVYFAKDVNTNKIIAYDQELNRYVQVNLLRISGDFEVEGRRVCFMASDDQIYCHTYNPSDSYSLPPTIFNQKVVGGYNFVGNENDPYDDNGHGTHVAAIAASSGNLKGVAPEAKIVAYKVLNRYGYGSTSDIVAALERAVQSRLDNNPSNDIDVVNMSLGRGCGGWYDWWCGPDDWMSRAVDNTVDAGIVVAVSAGNSGPDPQTIGSPGTARKAITVGAVDKNRQIADFSSRGPVPVFRSNEANSTPYEVVVKPDIVAPGVGICAAKANSFSYRSECIDSNHVSLNGTSMAAPHIAGVAALLKQKNPLWSPEEIKAAIKGSAVNLGENLYQDTNIYGSGLVDALAAASRPPASPALTPTGPTRSSIYISIKVPGIGNGARENKNPMRRERIVYVWIRNDDGRIIKTVRGAVNFDGTNYIGSVDLDLGYKYSDSYYITVKLDNSLAKQVSSSPVEIRPGITADLPTVTSMMGDINNDNVINISDFGELRRCFFKNTQSPEWSTCQTSDLNEDGRISITDYSRLVANFGRRGE